MIPVEILGLHVDPGSETTLVILGERGDVDRVVPIVIGPAEATAIAIGLTGQTTPRPLTHDLLISVTRALGGEVDALHITELRDGTFFADLVLSTDGGIVTVSSRPSDGLAIAIRTGIPVLMDPRLLEEAGVRVLRTDGDGYDDDQIERIVSEFRDVLATSDPASVAREIEDLLGDGPDDVDHDDDPP